MKITPKSPQEQESPEEEVRRLAYFRWIESGAVHGNDWDHWFAAEKQLSSVATLPVTEHERPGVPPAHFAIRTTVAEHLSDPTHRFHAPGAAHDARLDVVAGEARQRVRARQPRGS